MSIPVLIAPSILASDFSMLKSEIARAETAGADWLHLDIMDGHFVDNISFGPAFVEAVRKCTKLPLDVHLMIDRPDHYLDRFTDFANNITVHVEAPHDVRKTLADIREKGCTAGLSLNPATPFQAVSEYLSVIDLLLVMTVHPGFGGQPFQMDAMQKVASAKSFRDTHGLDFHIEVDGGINRATAQISAEHGANVFVAGTALFKAPDMTVAIREMREAIAR